MGEYVYEAEPRSHGHVVSTPSAEVQLSRRRPAMAARLLVSGARRPYGFGFRREQG